MLTLSMQSPRMRSTSFLPSKEQSKSCSVGKEVYMLANPGSALGTSDGESMPLTVSTL